MTYIIDGCKIDSCLRCSSLDFIIGYPILVCKMCNAIHSVSLGNTMITFNVGKYRIRICKDKSYINESEINVMLPYDITSEEKIRTYLVFS